MNMHKDSRIDQAFEAQNVHPIPEGSKPSEVDPAGLARQQGPGGYVMFTPRNLLQRTSEQRLLDFNYEYERAIRFWQAADKANDLAENAEARERTENSLEHAGRILKEIRENAYLVPARTIREVALKARLMSHGKAELWDSANAGEQDADIRFLVEDVLALGGMDRIKPCCFAFSDLLPGYEGPEKEERTDAVEHEMRPSALSPIHALAIESRDLWDLYTRIDSRRVGRTPIPTVLDNNLEAVQERCETIARQVSYMRPETLADAIFQLALVHDAVDAMGCKQSSESRSVSRMIVGVLELLSHISGVSLRDAGAEAYAKNLVQMENAPFADRYDPDRFDKLREGRAA